MDLNELRQMINEIDSQIVPLFCQRMNVALEVAKYKKEHNIPVLDKNREQQLLEKVSQMAGDEFDLYAASLYNTILEISRSYQHKYINSNHSVSEMINKAKKKTPSEFPKSPTVACQGVSGAYSEQACRKMFSEPSITFYNTFGDVFEAVNDGKCRYGLLPIENSIAGSVNQVYDLMHDNRFYIVRSIKLKVSHCLLVKKGVRREDIKTVYSHEQAVNQCSDFIASNNFDTMICKNTAVAAKFVAESDRNDIAAIASPLCADLYGLEPVEYDIQNYKCNYTRFICISKDPEIYDGANQASFMMNIPHVQGSLYAVLAKFSALGLNLLKLESRPLPDSNFEFMFYFDVVCNADPNALYTLCDELEATLPSFTYLGSYAEVM